MKKLSFFLAIALMLLTFSACGCEHQWNKATCLTPKTCSLCGETEGELAAHLFSPATCTLPKTCKVCEKTEGDATGHNFEDATCTSPKTCTKCGFTEGEALGHTWEPATYEKPSTCSVCGDTTGEKLTPPSEWGFYNLEEMDNALIQIVGGTGGADNIDFEEGSIIVYGDIMTFKNGYVYSSRIVGKNDSISFTNLTNPRPYKIIDNDNIIIESDKFSISERETFGTNDTVILKRQDMFVKRYIPYSLIDWDRGIEIVNASTFAWDNRVHYKLYIKQ